MKHLTLRVSALVCLLGASAFCAFSQSGSALRVAIPFSFRVGQATMPAGDYSIVETDNSNVMILQSRESKAAAAVITVNSGAPASSTPRLVFDRSNGEAVLVRVQMSEQSAKLIQSNGIAQLAR